jgi:hypothetical protein
MPRTSIEELMIKDGGLAADLARPDAPYNLEDEAAGHWRQIVNCMPAGHFIPANYHLLTQLCRHLVEADRVARLIRSYCQKKDNASVRTYTELLRAQDAQSLAIHRLSRSMRLSHQSTFSQKAVKIKRIAADQIEMPADEPSW